MARIPHGSARKGVTPGKRGKAAGKLPPDFFDQRRFPSDLRNAADKVIQETGVLDAKFQARSESAASLSDLGEKLRRRGNKSYYNQLALAYALWIQSASDHRVRQLVEQFRADKRKERRIDARSTALHFIVEALIEYGDGTSNSYREKRGLYNRDVNAIMWLSHKRVSPDQVEAFKLENKGSDDWARKFTNFSKRNIDTDVEIIASTGKERESDQSSIEICVKGSWNKSEFLKEEINRLKLWSVMAELEGFSVSLDLQHQE